MSAQTEINLNFRADIEGMRGLAILLVVAAHAGLPWLQGGFVGVDVFFVISGYLMTALLRRELERDGRVSLIGFYARRLRRLLPALLAMVFGVALLAYWVFAPFEQKWQIDAARMSALWLSNFHFASTDVDYFGPQAHGNLFLHTWSLGVEEQFYLLWPLVVISLSMTLTSVIRSPFRTAAMLGVLAIVGFVGAIVLAQFSSNAAFYMMPARAWQFAAGGVLYLLLQHVRSERFRQQNQRIRIPASVFAWAGLTAILIAAMYLDEGSEYPGAWSLLPTLGAVMLLWGAPSGAGSIYALLSSGLMQFFGRNSYGWYLWHWPAVVFGRELGYISGPLDGLVWSLVAMVPAVLVRKFLENPIRRNQWLSARPWLSLGLGIVLMVGAFMACNHWERLSENARVDSATVKALKARGDVARGYAEECDDWYRSDALNPCLIGPDDAPRTLVLWGDSVGAQWLSAFSPLARDGGWRVILLTKSACPIGDGPVHYARIKRRYIECERWRERALEWLATQRVDVLLVGSAMGNVPTAAEWTRQTRAMLRKVPDSVSDIAVIAPNPLVDFDGPACVARRAWQPKWLSRSSGCQYSLAVDSQNRLVTHALREAVRDVPRARVVDLEALICPGSVCVAETDGLMVYRDPQHLTDSFVSARSDEVLRIVLEEP